MGCNFAVYSKLYGDIYDLFTIKAHIDPRLSAVMTITENEDSELAIIEL